MYLCRLRDASDYPWKPILTYSDFQKLLYNLTSIKIRGTYSEKSVLVLTSLSIPEGYVEHFISPTLWMHLHLLIISNMIVFINDFKIWGLSMKLNSAWVA